MEKTFEYMHDFKNKKAEEVFDKILVQLKAENATVISSTHPNVIEAVHGSPKTVLVWKASAAKRLSFTISSTADGTNVKVKAAPDSQIYKCDVENASSEICSIWGAVLNDVWTGVENGTQSENTGSNAVF